MKKRILVIGITMAAAGSEKSFLSFANTIDYEKYDVDLLLARKNGRFSAACTGKNPYFGDGSAWRAV